MTCRTRTLSASLILVALLAIAATPAFAKMDAEAKLDTPISLDSAPGATIDVGWSVLSAFDGSVYPLTGSPIFIRLVSPDGRNVNEVMGTETPSGSGHYTASIVVPAGGIGEVVVGLFGESCVAGEACQRSDIIFPLTDDPLVSGAATPVTPAPTTPIATELAPVVAIVVAFAVAGGLAALVVGRRRALAANPTGR